MKVFVTGVKGQLGHDVMAELKKRGHEAVGTDIEELDITDEEAVSKMLSEIAPDAVVHCAAYTAVDAAEDNIELCRRINATGTKNIAQACGALGCKLLYLSTDYVFDGTGVRPWEPDDEKSPLNVYGLTKYEGECFIKSLTDKYFIVRISWVFGKNGKNFIKTMLRLSETNDRITVVDDQIGSPTYTFDLARLLVDMIETEKYGEYHATNEGLCSWYEFACEIFSQAGRSTRVVPVPSSEYRTAKAKRPMNSRMSKQKLIDSGFLPLPDWKDALARYLVEIDVNN